VLFLLENCFGLFEGFIVLDNLIDLSLFGPDIFLDLLLLVVKSLFILLYQVYLEQIVLLKVSQVL
jgi:hypothetical protein